MARQGGQLPKWRYNGELLNLDNQGGKKTAKGKAPVHARRENFCSRRPTGRKKSRQKRGSQEGKKKQWTEGSTQKEGQAPPEYHLFEKRRTGEEEDFDSGAPREIRKTEESGEKKDVRIKKTLP